MPIVHLRVPHVGPRLIRAGIPIAALAVAQLGFVVAPVAAAAPSVVIQADQPAAVPKGENWSFDDFFPRTLTVAQGTTIGFAIEGFHTATLLPAGTTAVQDNLSNGIATADAEDTTLNPNGTTHAAQRIPPVLNIPATGCGTDAQPCTFDGSSVVSAGAPLAGPPTGTFDVTVTAAPGTYAFHCRIHPLMTGTLTVVPAGGAATSQADIQSAVADQIKSDVAAGQAAVQQSSAAGVKHNADGTTTWTVTAGTSSPDGRTVVLEFLPRNIQVKPGDSVTWIPRGTNEPHTVTFPTDLHTDNVPLCENGATDSPATPTVNPPTGPFDFACGTGPADEIEFGGGNGVSTLTSPKTVADSGIVMAAGVAGLFGVPETATLTSWTASFKGAVAGTYTYICQIHGAPMDATITVLGAAAPPPTTPPATPPATTTSGGRSGGSGTPILPLLAAMGLLGGLGLFGTRRLAPRRSR